MKPLGKTILFGFCEHDGTIDMWFATAEGFALVAASPEGAPEIPEEDVLSDCYGGDADEIERLFKLDGFDLVNYENCADGCSLEFHCPKGVSIEKLNASAVACGFVDDAKYKAHVRGEPLED